MPALAAFLFAAGCGGKAASPNPRGPAPAAESRSDAVDADSVTEAGNASDPGAASREMNDATLLEIINDSVTLTDEMIAAAQAAKGDCKVMAANLGIVFDANARLLAQDTALRDVPSVDLRMAALLEGAAGERFEKAQLALGTELAPCSDSEDVAELFERLNP